jgi:hypothetical protein
MSNKLHTRVLLGAFLLACYVSLSAEPEQCPADKALERGYTAYDSFHDVMAPAWHTAWPAKDFGSLFKAGGEFASRIKAVDSIVPAMKSKLRREKFIDARKAFDELVTVYADACNKMDSAKCYELMPQVHDAFESSGALLGPIEFPHLDGILITLDVILDKHIPEKNAAGIEASTSTLVAKAKSFDTSMIPVDAHEFTPEVSALMARVDETSGKLAESAAAKEMATYTALCTDLRTAIRAFMTEWL